MRYYHWNALQVSVLTLVATDLVHEAQQRHKTSPTVRIVDFQQYAYILASVNIKKALAI